MSNDFYKNAKYSFNNHFFDEIDTAEKAYWIGFIWCDGSCRKSGNNYEFKLGLTREDEGHLYKLKDVLEAEQPVRQYSNTKNGSSRFFVSNVYFGKTLYDKYGLFPHRVSTDKLIALIPKEFYKDFIRGILDADGFINIKEKQYKTAKREEFRFGFTTHETLITFVNEVFLEEGFVERLYLQTSKKNSKAKHVKTIQICGNMLAFRILSWLYSGKESISLERKYKKAIHIKDYMEAYMEEKLNGKRD